LNLLGDCCPTDSSGIYLECCSHSNNNEDNDEDEDEGDNYINNNKIDSDNWFSLHYGSDESEKKSYTQNHDEGW